jgi:hypothetical protein
VSHHRLSESPSKPHNVLSSLWKIKVLQQEADAAVETEDGIDEGKKVI